jgi:hypothetical protein
MDDLIAAQVQRMADLALGCADKEVVDLTEDVKCALAWCAGVEMVTSEPEYTDTTVKFRWTTKNPIGIVKIDGKFRVCVLASSKGDQLRMAGLLHYDD